MNRRAVFVSGGFDNLRSPQLRFLHEAARFGELSVALWPDEMLQGLTGAPPKFPLAERRYFLDAVRHVARVLPVAAAFDPVGLPVLEGSRPRVWVDDEAGANPARREWCLQNDIEYHVVTAAQMSGFPEISPAPSVPGRRKVVVTGCYDWFHTGHVRFFEEVGAHGDLYVVVGNDANIRFLKGEGHPLMPQEERRYVVGSIKFVKQALIASGDGWIDADPEIRRIKPDIYAVNEDGDKGGKREYCAKMGIEYLVLQRTPAPGLTRRSSTVLRGF